MVIWAITAGTILARYTITDNGHMDITAGIILARYTITDNGHTGYNSWYYPSKIHNH